VTLEVSPRNQRLIAIAIALLLLLAGTFWVVLPVYQSVSLHAQRVTMLKRQLATMQRLVDAKPRIDAAITALAANPDIQNLTYAADQTALAVAQLQGQLNQVFGAVSASVTSSQVLPDAREGQLTKVSLQLTVEANISALVSAMHAIGEAKPLLTIEKISIKDPDGDWPATPQSRQPNTLIVDLVVSAYMRTP
jgi:type II secretory pathway component PulM